MTVLFVTSSDDKLAEVRRILPWPVDRADMDLDEPQAVDLETVVVAKAQQARARLGTAVLVEDSGLFIAAWNGLPGALVKWFLQFVGPAGICSMLHQFPSRQATARTLFAYHDKDVKIFEGSVAGHIPEAPRGDQGFGFDSIFVPDGSERTFAEMSPAEKDTFSMRQRALEKLAASDAVGGGANDDRVPLL
jgi:non-canonical purine NTP pyrophosphatase (RdgB/HAM1 family)